MENSAYSLVQIKESATKNNVAEVEEEWQPRPILEQVGILAKEFNLNAKVTLEFLEKLFPEMILPPTSQGWFAIPTIDAVIASSFPYPHDPTENYQKLTQLVLDKISNKFWEFENLDCKSTPDKFHLPARTKRALETICTQQTGPILVIPVRFNSKPSTTTNNEFLLGSFFTACLGLTHSERYPQTDRHEQTDKKIECIGFGQVRCRTCWFDDARIKWNQATGFVPKFRKDS